MLNSHYNSDDEKEDNYVILPPSGRARIKFLLDQLEKEFDRVYSENGEMKRKLMELGITEFTNSVRRQTSRAIKLPFFSKKGQGWKVKMLKRMLFHEDMVWDVKSCYDENEGIYFVITAGADGKVHIILEEDIKQPILTYAGHRGSVNNISYNQETGIICSASGGGNCHLWKVDLGQLSDVIPRDSQFRTTGLSDDDDLDTLDQDLDSFESDDDDGPKEKDKSKNFDTKIIRKKDYSLRHASVVNRSCWIDKDKLATTCWDGKIRIFSAETGNLEESINGLELDRITDLSFSGKKTNLIASSGRSGFVRIWDVRTFREPVREIQAHDKCNTVAFTFDEDSCLLTAGEGGNCKMWKLTSLQKPFKKIHCGSEVNQISVENDKFTLALTKPWGGVYDSASGKLLFQLKSDIAHHKMITSVCLSKSPRKFAFTTSIDQGVVQWSYRRNT